MRKNKKLRKFNLYRTVKYRLTQLWRCCVRVPLGLLRKPQGIAEVEEYDGIEPVCPRCGEFAYNLDYCAFCGQRFLHDDIREKWATPGNEERMDCFMCDGKNTMVGKRSKINGHFSGKCARCGARMIE